MAFPIHPDINPACTHANSNRFEKWESQAVAQSGNLNKLNVCSQQQFLRVCLRKFAAAVTFCPTDTLLLRWRRILCTLPVQNLIHTRWDGRPSAEREKRACMHMTPYTLLQIRFQRAAPHEVTKHAAQLGEELRALFNEHANIIKSERNFLPIGQTPSSSLLYIPHFTSCVCAN